MAYYVGNKIGVSKEVGIMDLYTKNAGNKADGAYEGFPGSALSLQDGNQTLGGASVVGGFGDDLADGVTTGRHSGTYRDKYVGEPTSGHNEFEVFVREHAPKIGEKPDPAVFFGD